jgi:hypothetical protein
MLRCGYSVIPMAVCVEFQYELQCQGKIVLDGDRNPIGSVVIGLQTINPLQRVVHGIPILKPRVTE